MFVSNAERNVSLLLDFTFRASDLLINKIIFEGFRSHFSLKITSVVQTMLLNLERCLFYVVC